METPPNHEFADFATRFVDNYWREVACGIPEFPGYEPCEQTTEELLSEVEHQIWVEPNVERDRADQFVLRMTRAHCDSWTFRFCRTGSEWTLLSATADDADGNVRNDLLDSVYSRWFGPFLSRIIHKSF